MIRFAKRIFTFFYIISIFINATIGSTTGSLEHSKIAILMLLAVPAKMVIQNFVFPFIKKKIFA